MKKYIILSFAALSIISCKTVSTVNKPVNSNLPVASDASFYKKILAEESYEALKINSKVDIENGSFIPTLNATLYLEKDKKVWLNLSALFINVARGLADEQGVKGYEIYNKTYIDSNFGYLNNLLNVNFIDLKSLQNLLTGKTFIPINENDFKLTKNSAGYNLKSVKNQIISNNGKTSEYIIDLNYTSDFHLSTVTLQDAKSPDKLEVLYSNWEINNNISLPKNVKIIINGKKRSEILLENTRFDFSKMDTPYSVPNNYQKTEIK
ncbi:DUF4292 domain-containing protein [Halpernia frigidisoli]|uniref:DUF4292 domain-containing protein n=1 Tax=Halpernia frigidisoli TaxID=1125876 RepID=A0A1I3GG01_9FLAO|nr:DUF4292 domain-containing protein [Halpernia frigidisoli]SFI22081.1 protein of unknown function [Halpernia frigidisoli]